MNEKKKLNFNIHVIFGIILAAILITCIVRLIQWNGRSKIVDLSGIKDGDYDLECQDFYVYPDEEARVNHPDNGQTDILIMGNYLINNYGEEHSILNNLKEGLDANITDISVDKAYLANELGPITYGKTAFALNNLTNSIIEKSYFFQNESVWSEVFASEERYNTFLKTLESVDFNDYDIVIIMYSMQDYYGKVPELFENEENPFGYHGAIYSTAKTLMEKYPHLQIILSSPVPTYLETDDEIILGSQTDYGVGKETVFFNHQYAVATQLGFSFIDNYFYKINESNIKEYSDGLNLTDKGIDTISDHIINFINNKGQ